MSTLDPKSLNLKKAEAACLDAGQLGGIVGGVQVAVVDDYGDGIVLREVPVACLLSQLRAMECYNTCRKHPLQPQGSGQCPKWPLQLPIDSYL